MSYGTTVALIFSLAVVLASSQPLWTGEGTVSLDSPYNSTLPTYNFQTGASLSLSQYTHPVYVCVVLAEFGLPHWTQYSIENCLYYFNVSKTGSDSVDFALLHASYKVGVYMSADPKKGDNTTIKLELNGQTCNANAFYDQNPKTCVTATALQNLTESFSANFAKGETKFWTFSAPSNLGYLRFSLLPGQLVSSENAIIYARFNAGPSKETHDYSEDTNGTVTIPSPAPGQWVFSVYSAEGGAASFHLTGEQCGSNSAGVGCVIPVHNAFNNMTLSILQGQWVYMRFVALPEQGLRVSVTTVNGSDIPHIYASRGQIPVAIGSSGAVSADVHNCNGNFCSIVRNIAHNVTAPEEWYIGITGIHGNTTYGVWFNGTCPDGCETDNHGTCEDSGRCDCEIDFEGIDCSISKGLGPQYIVLIIIASLVVASAIIGFVAWAYMRRKRANYEIVS